MWSVPRLERLFAPAIPDACTYVIHLISPECIALSCEPSHIQLFWWIFQNSTLFNKKIYPYYVPLLQCFHICIFQQPSLESVTASFRRGFIFIRWVILFFPTASEITISVRRVSQSVWLIFNKQHTRSAERFIGYTSNIHHITSGCTSTKTHRFYSGRNKIQFLWVRFGPVVANVNFATVQKQIKDKKNLKGMHIAHHISYQTLKLEIILG